MTDTKNPADEPVAEDPWAAALAEQQASESQGPESVLKPLVDIPVQTQVEARHLEMVRDIPITMSVVLGKAKTTIKNLLELSQGSVVQLDGMAGSPLDILINNYLIAKGEVVVVNEHYGIRITEIMSESERMQKLAS